MKKLLILLCIPILFLCNGCTKTEGDLTSQIKMEVRHIVSADGNKTVKITYPVIGGIEDSRTLATINNSIVNYVEMQENEFNNALNENTESTPIVEDFDPTTATQIDSKTTFRIYYDEEGNPVDRDGNPIDEETLAEYYAKIEEQKAEKEAEKQKNNGDTNTNAAESSSDDTASNTEEENTDAEGTPEESGDAENTDASTEKKDTAKTNEEISLNMTFQVTYNKNNILNILASYTKVLGKNKTYIGQQSFVFDLEKGLPVALGDVYDFNGEFPTFINDTINKQITDSNMQLYEDKSGFAGIRKDANFYINESTNTIHIYYNALEISPEKELIPTFIFDIKKLSPYLTENYAERTK